MKKKPIAMLGVLCAVLLSCAFVACDGIPAPEPVYYVVTFDLDGGTFGDTRASTVTVETGTELHLSTYAPQKEGFTFGGWKDGETSYAADGKITVSGDVTLTAQWTKNRYTVTLNVGAGTLTESSVSAEHGEELDLALYTPVPENAVLYRFAGWNRGETTFAKDAKIVVTQNMTLTAVYEFNTANASDFTFSEPSEGEVTLTGVSQDFDPTTVVLPAVDGDGNKITAIGANAFARNGTVTTLYLDAMTHLKSIEGSAFARMTALETVSLQGLKQLTNIGSNAFSGGYQAPCKLRTVDFSGCTALQKIEQSAFAYQGELKNVDFSACTALESLERQMFDDCPKLETLALPVSLRYVGGYSSETEGPNGDFFRGNTGLKSVTVDPDNPYFCSENGIWYDKAKTRLIKYPVANAATNMLRPQVCGRSKGWPSNLPKI